MERTPFLRSKAKVSTTACCVLVLLAASVAGCGNSDNEVPAVLNPGPPIRKTFILDLNEVARMVRNYAIENGRVPQGDGVEVLVASGIRSAPRIDPWGNAVKYHGEGEHFSLESAGPDTRWGTGDDIKVTDAQMPGMPSLP